MYYRIRFSALVVLALVGCGLVELLHKPTHPGRTPHVVGQGLVLLMMGIIMPETC